MNKIIKKVKRIFGEEPTCPDCGLLMTPQWENVGFQEPDPSKHEITGYICSNCGHKED